MLAQYSTLLVSHVCFVCPYALLPALLQKAKSESDDGAQSPAFEFEVTELRKAIVELHGEMVN